MILTQTSGIIMGPVTKLLGFIFSAIYNLFNGMGVESIALSIVVFTILIRLILFPFTVKQTKSSKIQQYLRPEFNKINKKYKGKKDNESMMAQQKETRELQEKYGIKMTQGCLTSILQFPIFIGLYNVIQNIPSYVGKIGDLYKPIAQAIINTNDSYSIIKTFVDENKIMRISSKLEEFSVGVDITTEAGKKTLDQVIDILYRCNGELFGKLSDAFSSNPDVLNAITQNSDKISRVNSFFFGINLSEAPGLHLTPALLIPILSGICQLLAMIVTPMSDTGDPQQDAQMKSMRRTMYFMPVMSFIVTVNAPAGLGIYWATSALISFLTTVFTNMYYDHVDMEKIVEKQRLKAEKDIAKRKASGKKSFSEKLTEAAMGQSQESQSSNASTANKLSKYGNMNLKYFETEDSVDDDSTDSKEQVNLSKESDNNSISNSNKKSPKKGSLADKANAVKRFNDSGV